MARYCLFQPGFRMTDCKEQRKTVKSPDSAWEKAEERRKKTQLERKLERLVEKNELKTTFWGTETGTLSHRIMARYKLGCAAAEEAKNIRAKDQPVPAAFMQMKTCRILLNFKALFCPIFSNVAVNPKAWEKCQTCIRLNSNSQVVCGAEKCVYMWQESLR